MSLSLTVRQYTDHWNKSDGLCLSCQAFSEGGIEPDARDYMCEYCNERSVVGIEVALYCGEIDIKG
jgi:hypothetical protein